MKTIVIPTDFSECATNALRYAADFAASLKTDVHLVLLHIVNVQVLMPEDDATGQQMGLPRQYPEYSIEQQDELTRAGEIRLKNITEEFSHLAPLVRCSGVVRVGFFLQEIENLVKETQADLIVMGTCGAETFPRTLFATNSYSVVEENLADVLVIHDGLRYRPYKTLVFAADLDERNTEELRRTIGYAVPTSARILVTHVEDYDSEDVADGELMSHLWEHVRSAADYPHIDYHTELANNIEEGLDKVLARENVDVLVMCPREYSFIGNLFHKSHTRAALQHPDTVVLCLAHAEKS